MSTTHRIRFLPGGKTVTVSDGTTLYEAARGAFAMPDAVCGGNGTCGKCALDRIENGERTRVLACQTAVTRDMTVCLPERAAERIVLSGACGASFPLTAADGYAAAFDVGTTTLVCYLLDRKTGRQLASAGALNPQASFGADVITRAKHALENGAAALRDAALSGMNRLLGEVTASAGVPQTEITLCSIVGNSCMQHLLLDLPLRSLVTAPYVPFSTDAVVTNAASLGLHAHPDAPVRVLPLIGGFIGADTVGCLLATDIARLPGNTLLLDIGTNGELVLNAGGKRLACSAAAGPALEGGRICCGMRGAEGAIDRVRLTDGVPACSVIGGGRPAGLCGSGLIDLIARLLETDMIDAGGRMRDTGPLAPRMRHIDGMRAFEIASGHESGTGRPLLLTQRDVREVQLAKSAIASGIGILTDAAGLRAADIDRVLLAGAFGNSLDAASACAIGLIPGCLRDRVHPVGNAAGEGAKLAALSDDAFAFSKALARGTAPIDTAADPSFQKRFLDGLAFPAAPAQT